MTPEELKDIIFEANPDAFYADGFESALIGYVVRFNLTLPLYDYEQCIRILKERDGMTTDDAGEFFEFNVIGAWVGDGTPAFAVILRR